MTMIPYVKNDLFNSEVQLFFYFLKQINTFFEGPEKHGGL